ncbi:MAG: hypothetical protein HZA23_01925 [Nitrospirae bacterium]|nr:hypothetical protein [Nitrospirota bacterium]
MLRKKMGSHFRLQYLILFSLAGLLLLADAAAGEPPSHFYALGWVPAKARQIPLYKVHTETKRVLASVDVPNGSNIADFALSENGRLLWVLGVYAEIFTFDADRLFLREQFSVRSEKFPIAGALFVHPKSGLLYLARLGGSGPREVAIVDPRLRKIMKVLKLDSITTRGFVYDPKRDRLYLTAAPPAIFDPSSQKVTGYIKLPTRDDTVFWMDISKDGKEMFLYAPVHDPDRRESYPTLFVYDLDRATVVRQATLYDLRSLNTPALTPDSQRLFAITSRGGDPGTAVVIDTQTLKVLHTLTFPEPIGHFLQAPDGRGMWLTYKDDIIYRLDERSGQILEQVSLPFRFSKIILPP